MMSRAALGGLLFACLALAPVTLSSAVPQERPLGTMRFELKREGSAETCRDNCRLWIFASGLITPEAPRDFDRFTRTNDVRGATLVLDSNGGSVIAALALGRLVRSLGLNTMVGKAIALPSDRADPRANVSPQASCESMCAFVLLAGTRRYVPSEARVMVHQIWLGDRRDDATAAGYSAEDVSLVQRDIGRIVRFVQEMGGSFELLEATLRVPPWERLRMLSRDELRRMGLDQTEPAAEPETVSVVAASTPRAGARPLSATDRGWTFINEEGQPTLTRRHPLTVEGDEVGSFQVALTCGETPESYHVTYSERRSMYSRVGSDSLKEIGLLLGGRTVPLTVASSGTAQRSSVLSSVAQGALPSSLIKDFASGRPRSMTVETVSSTDERTAIRMGNSGVSQALDQLALTCSGPLMQSAARGVHAEAQPRE
jgi:hypothetical protein